MALGLTEGTYGESWTRLDRLAAERRLNILAMSYGYKYRLDIWPRTGPSRVEFVRTLREARFFGMPIRRSKGVVSFFKLSQDGTRVRRQW